MAANCVEFELYDDLLTRIKEQNAFMSEICNLPSNSTDPLNSIIRISLA
jgi:hypothetical protein